MLRRSAMIVSCGLLCGCEPPADAYTKKPDAAYSTPVAAERETKPTPPVPAEATVQPNADGVKMVREPARAGISDKSRYDPNIATTPLNAHFSIQQQIIFDASIPKGMELFEGVHNRKPRSHQEFMQQIIGKNSIRLPPLPPQYRYIYDPERGELMVEYPLAAD